MLIPLGFLASSGGVDGSYELIATALGTGSSNTITFSSIPQAFKHLEIRAVLRSSGFAQSFTIRFNGNSDTLYSSHKLVGNGSSVDVGVAPDQPHISFDSTLGASSEANVVGAAVMQILDYSSTNKNTTLRSLGGVRGTSNSIHLNSGLFRSTSAITSLSLIAGGTDFFSNLTRVSIYGIKG